MEGMNFKSICEKLEADRRLKIIALEELQIFCENQKPTQVEVQLVFDECYLHILKCYADRYENVRFQAAQTVSQFIKRMPPNDCYLSYIIAALVERIGRDETLEESEEMRLLYIQQMNLLLSHYSCCLDEVFENIHSSLSLIIKRAIRDAFPVVQREACAIAILLSKSLSKKTKNFQKLVELLAKSFYSILNHKHSLVRIATVEALGCLSLHVDCSEDSLSRLLMEISPLLMDSMPLVRRECGKVGILLLMHLNDRYSYFDRIIPLVLCCLKDESPEVVTYIQPLWIKCGQQYFEENETELRKQEIADITPENYPAGVERPTIGCRAIVQRSLRLLKLITKETADWKDNVRLHSLRLLYQFVLHAEATMTAKFFEIYPDLARACRDYEYTISSEANKVADLMGRLFCYADWFEHAFEGLSNNPREGYLICFYSMFNAVSSQTVTFENHQKISKLLLTPEFSQSLKPVFQKYVVKLASSVLQKAYEIHADHSQIEEIERNIYISTVKVSALVYNSEIKVCEVQNHCQDIFQAICKRQNKSLEKLSEKYITKALDFVQIADTRLDGLSEPILLLNGLIGIAKFREPYLNKLQAKILSVFQNCSSDAKIKILAVVSTEIFLWSETIGKELNESAHLLKNFLEAIVSEHLAWRAGATAEALRALSAAIICSVSQGAPNEAKLVLPLFSRRMPSLLEDHFVRVRYYAIKSLMNFGEVPIEELKPIAYATLQRLDDPSNDIRTLAVTVIPQLRPRFEGGDKKCESMKTWQIFLKNALDVLIIHYEGPDCRIKEHIRGVIMELAHSNPEVVTDCFKRANQHHYSTTILQKLQQELLERCKDN